MHITKPQKLQTRSVRVHHKQNRNDLYGLYYRTPEQVEVEFSSQLL